MILRRNILFSIDRGITSQSIERIMLLSLCLLGLLLGDSQAWGSDKVKLTDLKTITLYSGKMTNGRRTAPVPQLECVGGSAGCTAFIPQVVQCYNRGYDGYDVQWECKTDMDNAYRFGKIEVTCEGYDYPDDPYVLKGSCGLRYTLDFTKEGYQKKQHSYGRGYGDYSYSKVKSGLLTDVIVLVIVVIIIYAIIKTCLHRNQYSTTDDDYPQDDSRYFSGGFRSQAPPPPGFRTDHMPPGGCGGPTTGSSSTGGGFWTGAMTGGILGYMFGSRSQQPYSSWGSSHSRDYNYSRPSWSDDSSSSGTRTASGFGGTTRR